MCIPIIFTCGYNNYVTDCGPSGPCSRCGQPTELYSTTTRFQFCFIPLCKDGDAAYESRCRSCGARYPVAAPQAVQMQGKG